MSNSYGVEPDASLARNVQPLVARRVWFLVSFLLVRVACAESLPIFVNRMLDPLQDDDRDDRDEADEFERVIDNGRSFATRCKHPARHC